MRAPRGDDPLHHVAALFELDDEGVPQRLARADEQQALLAQPRLETLGLGLGLGFGLGLG